MRIISGTLKGRRIDLIKGSEARPTTDRVRGALFNILYSKLPGASMLDVFSGCGAVGIEAISRGVLFVMMADRDRPTVKHIKELMEDFDIDEHQYSVECMEYRRLLNRELKKGNTYDIIFVDPPYASGYYKDVITTANEGLLADDGILIAEHSTSEKLPERVGDVVLYDKRRYGSTNLSFYRKDV